VGADPAVEPGELLVGEAEIGFADRDEFPPCFRRVAPQAEGIVGIAAAALAVAALGIHQDGVDGEGVAFPFPPFPLGTAREVGGGAVLEHQALDAGRTGACAQFGELVEGGEGNEFREVHAGGAGAGEPVFQAGAAGVEGQLAQVLGAVEQQVVEADGGGMVGAQLGADGLAVEALLQVGEGGDGAVADDQEFAVEHALEIHGFEDFGEGGGDILRATGVEAAAARGGDELDADAVPFPFRAENAGVEGGEVFGFERVGEHRGAEDGGGGGVGLLGVTFEPGEERQIGGREAVPNFLDVIGGGAALGEFGERDAGEAAGGADAQAAGDELQQGETGSSVGGVEPAGDEGGEAGLGGEVQRLDHVRERGGRGVGVGVRPDQGDGFGEVADEVVGQGEEGGVGAGAGQFADEGGLGGGEVEFTGDGGEGQAAVGVGLGFEILAQQADLVVAALGEEQAFEEGGEGDHAAPPGGAGSSSSP